MEWRNQQAFWAVLVTLIVGIFLFAQGYIMFFNESAQSPDDTDGR